jgi:hypothetical protein
MRAEARRGRGENLSDFSAPRRLCGGEGGRCPFGRGGMRGLAAGFEPRNGRVRAAGDGGGGTGFTTETRRDLKFALAVSCIRAWAQNQNREGAEEAEDAEKIFLISLRLGGSAVARAGDARSGAEACGGLAAGFGPGNGRVRAAGDGGGGTGIHHRGAAEAGPANPAALDL